MSIDKYIVITSGIGLIGFIWWFFFGKKDEVVESSNNVIKIKVSGGYSPSVIKVKKRIQTTLMFTRVEANSCLDEVVIPDFAIKEYLPLNEDVIVKIVPSKKGEFRFQCGMNMYSGKIIVS